MNSRLSFHEQAFLKSIRQGDVPAVRQALSRKVPIDVRGASGETALMIAVEEGNAQVAGLLVASGANVNTTDYSGDTALHYACKNGEAQHHDCVRLLLSMKPNLNATNQWGSAPLHLCAVKNNATAFSLLVEAGANRHAKSIDGKSLGELMMRAGFHQSPLLKMLQSLDARDAIVRVQSGVPQEAPRRPEFQIGRPASALRT